MKSSGVPDRRQLLRSIDIRQVECLFYNEDDMGVTKWVPTQTMCISCHRAVRTSPAGDLARFVIGRPSIMGSAMWISAAS
jgi:hypothetical protein